MHPVFERVPQDVRERAYRLFVSCESIPLDPKFRHLPHPDYPSINLRMCPLGACLVEAGVLCPMVSAFNFTGKDGETLPYGLPVDDVADFIAWWDHKVLHSLTDSDDVRVLAMAMGVEPIGREG